MDSEQKQRQFQKDLLCGTIRVDKPQLEVRNPKTNKDEMKEVPVVSVGDLPTFVTNLLDQYEEKNMLTWHGSIPRSQIWIKIGGDHGDDSFKVVLSVVNVSRPNAKDNCFLISIVEAKDSIENLRTILGPLKDQIREVEETGWRGKDLKVFLFGDYDFLLKMFGLSGAQACHPCLWCEMTKDQMQSASVPHLTAERRTLTKMTRDHARFMRAGGRKINAKSYNNVIGSNVWDIELDRVVPPYLHILLGIVKKHHDLMEEELHDLDKRIALSLAAEDKPDLSGTSVAFRKSVKQIKRLCVQQKTTAPSLNGLRPFEKHHGPVFTRVDEVLKQHRIKRQAHYSGTFIGNHCHKYLKTRVNRNICKSIVREVKDLTVDPDVCTVARSIRDKYMTLNELYGRVHRSLSSTKQVRPEDTQRIEDDISRYMVKYRCVIAAGTANVIPKQHILEEHCVEWVRRWGFGMALLGEQGGEAMHGVVKQLKRRAWAVTEDDVRLALIMKEQWVLASPKLIDTPKKKRGLRDH